MLTNYEVQAWVLINGHQLRGSVLDAHPCEVQASMFIIYEVQASMLIICEVQAWMLINGHQLRGAGFDVHPCEVQASTFII